MVKAPSFLVIHTLRQMEAVARSEMDPAKKFAIIVRLRARLRMIYAKL